MKRLPFPACLPLVLSLLTLSLPVRAQLTATEKSLGKRAPEFTPTKPISIDPNTQLCWPLLQRNTKDASVTTLQKLLTARGYATKADGKFGYGTETAVRRFQRARRLQQDGIVGWQTWKVLVPTLKIHSRGANVRILQTQINSYGHNTPKVRVDGVYGAATERAVTSLRSSLAASPGVADDVVWCHLVGGMFTPFE